MGLQLIGLVVARVANGKGKITDIALHSLPGSPGVQHLGYLGISSLISLKNASLGRLGASWSWGVDGVCAADVPHVAASKHWGRGRASQRGGGVGSG